MQKSFKIAIESPLSHVKKAVGFDDILTGDENFDQKIHITADEPLHIIALLNHKVRSWILQLTTTCDTFKITEKGLVVTRNLKSLPTSRSIRLYTGLLKHISKNFLRNISIKKQLLKNITSDPVPEVRLINFSYLIDNYQLDRRDRAKLTRVLGYRNSKLQFTIAQMLGKKGLKHLTAMIKNNAIIDDWITLCIIQLLGKHKHRESIPAMIDIYKTSHNENVKVEVLDALSVMEDQQCSSFLVKELDSENSDIVLKSIKALASCGTVKAIEKLIQIAETSFNPLIKNAVQKSISQIQSRLGDVENGWLSVSDFSHETGALSIAEDATDGSLSIDHGQD